MKPDEFMNLIFDYNNGRNKARIIDAISSGAGWEVWLQVELLLLFRELGRPATREISYPSPHTNWKLDLSLTINQAYYAIELKVESATNTSSKILYDLQADIDKIQNFHVNDITTDAELKGRWVIAFAYSIAGRRLLSDFANQLNATYREEENAFGVIIVSV